MIAPHRIFTRLAVWLLVRKNEFVVLDARAFDETILTSLAAAAHLRRMGGGSRSKVRDSQKQARRAIERFARFLFAQKEAWQR